MAMDQALLDMEARLTASFEARLAAQLEQQQRKVARLSQIVTAQSAVGSQLEAEVNVQRAAGLELRREVAAGDLGAAPLEVVDGGDDVYRRYAT